VAAFRQAPGKVRAVQRAIPELCIRTVKRAWEQGIAWADFPEAREPIKVLIEGEQTRQRVALVRQESTEQAIRQDAQRDVAQSRMAEANMVRLGRASVTALLANTTKLATAAVQVGDAVADSIKHHGVVFDAQGEPRPHTMAEVRSLVSVLAKVGALVKQLTESAQATIESDRLVNGEPTAIVGVVHRCDDITQEEADKRMQAAMRALTRAKEQGLFAPDPKAKVIDVTPISKP